MKMAQFVAQAESATLDHPYYPPLADAILARMGLSSAGAVTCGKAGVGL